MRVAMDYITPKKALPVTSHENNKLLKACEF